MGRVKPVTSFKLWCETSRLYSIIRVFPSHCFRGVDFFVPKRSQPFFFYFFSFLLVWLEAITHREIPLSIFFFCYPSQYHRIYINIFLCELACSCWSLKPNHQLNRCSACSFVMSRLRWSAPGSPKDPAVVECPLSQSDRHVFFLRSTGYWTVYSSGSKP